MAKKEDQKPMTEAEKKTSMQKIRDGIASGRRSFLNMTGNAVRSLKSTLGITSKGKVNITPTKERADTTEKTSSTSASQQGLHTQRRVEEKKTKSSGPAMS